MDNRVPTLIIEDLKLRVGNETANREDGIAVTVKSSHLNYVSCVVGETPELCRIRQPRSQSTPEEH